MSSNSRSAQRVCKLAIELGGQPRHVHDRPGPLEFQRALSFMRMQRYLQRVRCGAPCVLSKDDAPPIVKIHQTLNTNSDDDEC